MIKASATLEVPWGFVCGYPTNRGDLYGGAHYSQSSAATLTAQGRAIAAASRRFGNGETLPFTPCKRGFIPVVGNRPLFACHLHDKYRRARVKKEGNIFRNGEVDLADFWKRQLGGEELESSKGIPGSFDMTHKQGDMPDACTVVLTKELDD